MNKPAITVEMFTGHMLVMALLKRVALQGGRTPTQAERLVVGPPLEEIDARVPLVESGAMDEHGDPIRYREKTFDPSWQSRGKMGDMFADACARATGRPIRMHVATPSDLWRTAQYLALQIERHGPSGDLHPHYPDGWRDAYELVRRARGA